MLACRVHGTGTTPAWQSTRCSRSQHAAWQYHMHRACVPALQVVSLCTTYPVILQNGSQLSWHLSHASIAEGLPSFGLFVSLLALYLHTGAVARPAHTTKGSARCVHAVDLTARSPVLMIWHGNSCIALHTCTLLLACAVSHHRTPPTLRLMLCMW